MNKTERRKHEARHKTTFRAVKFSVPLETKTRPPPPKRKSWRNLTEMWMEFNNSKSRQGAMGFDNSKRSIWTALAPYPYTMPMDFAEVQ
jgi:hypothetical protein